MKTLFCPPIPFIDETKIHAILFIANKLIENNIQPDIYKILKIIYFAEKEHLKITGRTICDDTFIAMKDGPVPSKTYDIIKSVRGNGIYSIEGLEKYFYVKNPYYIIPNIEADLNKLSESNIHSLEKSITENSSLSFSELRRKSHDEAYNNADERDNTISYKSMATVAGAEEEMLDYIDVCSENDDFALFISSSGK
ncbi:MAG: Panacea domain-containing protein [bacterium]